MRKIPSALNAQFEALLVKNKIPQRFHSHYLKWLRYYLDFCQRYRFSESNSQSLPNFIWKLKEKRQTDAQQKQANEAIHIYYELIRSKPSNNTSELPKHTPKPEGDYLVKGNWHAAYKQLSNEIKVRHYSPKTLHIPSGFENFNISVKVKIRRYYQLRM